MGQGPGGVLCPEFTFWLPRHSALVIFLTTVTKHRRDNLMKERFIWAHGLGDAVHRGAEDVAVTGALALAAGV